MGGGLFNRPYREEMQRADRPAGADRALIVAMPVTPGLPGGAPLANVPDATAAAVATMSRWVVINEILAPVMSTETSSTRRWRFKFMWSVHLAERLR
jgi:hypothetical protein